MIKAINRILLEDWDVIGVGDDPDAEDEYAGEARDIYALLVQGASTETIVEYLWKAEEDICGERWGKMRLNAVALRIQNLYNGSHLLL